VETEIEIKNKNEANAKQNKAEQSKKEQSDNLYSSNIPAFNGHQGSLPSIQEFVPKILRFIDVPPYFYILSLAHHRPNNEKEWGNK
jgi:cobalamin-dependent methionine synthase I